MRPTRPTSTWTAVAVATHFTLLVACGDTADSSNSRDKSAAGDSSLSSYVKDNPLPRHSGLPEESSQPGLRQVVLAADNPAITGGSRDDADSILQIVGKYQRRWLEQDNDGLIELLDPNVYRVRDGIAATGTSDVVKVIAGEVRSGNPEDVAITLQITIYDILINTYENFAYALYRLAVHAGGRQEYTDIATVLQLFVRADADWKISGHIESLELGDVNAPPVSERVPSRRSPFHLDLVYPVRNLDRAIEFYTPLLGEALAISESSASFRLGNSLFRLEAEPLNRRMALQENSANGYAVFEVANFGAINRWMSDAEWSGVVFSECGFDRCVISEDPSDNIVVWRRDRPQQTEEPVWPGASFDVDIRDDTSLHSQVLATMTDWMSTDADAIVDRLATGAVWIDDSDRVASDEAGIRRSLNSRWRPFFRGTDGIDGDLVISNLRIRPIDDYRIATFRATADMRTDPTDSFAVHAMQIWRTDGEREVIELSYFARARVVRDVPVLGLAYTIYPASRLGATGRYYKIILGAEPYKDVNWFGFWSTSGVFGLQDGDEAIQHTPHHSNGIAEFSVRSLDEVMTILGESESGSLATGDAVGAQTTRRGRQILAADSEGNLVRFRE